MARGSLRIYLGAAPGVGKTYKMLGEGVRRADRGTDVVIGLVETHGRVQTAEQMHGLEVVPRCEVTYRDTVLHEMDVDAILARRPEVVLVDEYAHTNAPGSRNEKRWQDVEQLLDAGIEVISTLNVQHLESLNDVIKRITGTTQRETVPDEIVRRADQLELVDMAPEAIRRRMAHGNIYPPNGSTPRSPTTSGPATSAPCANWPCCGWPTASRSRSPGTSTRTASPTRGRPANAWSSA